MKPTPGILDLKDSQRGRPAVVVSAGPSLTRNVDLLRGQEDHFVIVATLTTVKTLLDRGIRPHYACALDWSDIQRRFLEGLTRPMVQGTHLLVLPTVNHIVPDLWPGTVRMTGDPMLDMLLGEDLSSQRGTLPGAQTVAHLCYHLCRHMGCDPVMLIGQDLAFTDGAYYGPGAALHTVRQSELNEFYTLEMVEHERVRTVRAEKVRGWDGKEVWTDFQMAAYLANLSAQFTADAAMGLTTIDATEGGAAKAGAINMPLAAAMEKHRPEHPHRINATDGWRFRSLEEEVRKYRMPDIAGGVLSV